MNFTFTFLMDAIKVGRELAPAIDQHANLRCILNGIAAAGQALNFVFSLLIRIL